LLVKPKQLLIQELFPHRLRLLQRPHLPPRRLPLAEVTP